MVGVINVLVSTFYTFPDIKLGFVQPDFVAESCRHLVSTDLTVVEVLRPFRIECEWTEFPGNITLLYLAGMKKEKWEHFILKKMHQKYSKNKSKKCQTVRKIAKKNIG